MMLSKEKLAFEYQGQQHYYDVHALGSQWFQKQRDQEKRELCKKKEIRLIEIPYWWDFKKSSLITTIHFHRPDLIPFPGYAEPIPDFPLEESGGKASGLMHGEEWDGKQNLQGW